MIQQLRPITFDLATSQQETEPEEDSKPSEKGDDPNAEEACLARYAEARSGDPVDLIQPLIQHF